MKKNNNNQIVGKDSSIIEFDHSSHLIISLCPRCKKKVRMVFPIEAATISDLSLRKIFRLIEDEKLHFIETREKVLMICANSIADFTKN